MEKLLTSLENFKYLCQGKAGVIYYNNEAGTLLGPDVDMLQYLLHSAEGGSRLQLRSNVRRACLGEGHFSAVFTHENSQNETIKIFKGYYGDEAAYRYLRLCGNCWNAVDKRQAAQSPSQEGTEHVSEYEGDEFEEIHRNYMPKVRAIGKIAVVEPDGRCYTAAYAIMPKYYPVKARDYRQDREQCKARGDIEADFYDNVKPFLPNSNGDIHEDNVMCSTEKWDPKNMILTDPVYSRERLPVYSNVALPADFQKHCPVAVRCTAEPSIATERWVGMVPPDVVQLAPLDERERAKIRQEIYANPRPILEAWEALQFFGELR